LSPEYSPAVRRNKEIIVLLALLVGMMAFVLWYVIDRRAKNRLPTDAKQSAGQTQAGQQAGTGPVTPTKQSVTPAKP